MPPAETQGNAVLGLIQRLLPERWQQFALEHIADEDGLEVFELETVDGMVVLRGSSGVAQASALNWYLKYHCGCQVSWEADQLNLPARLPKVGKVHRTSSYRYRHYPEHCAFAYSLPYWGWDRWEREIDLMALHGINLPLALTGFEAVWLAVYRGLGFDEEQLRRSLAGPAYLPFQWFGFFENFDERSLTAAWIESHLELGRRILERERAFGMRPVLQAFSGPVPAVVAKKYKGQAAFHSTRWVAGLPETMFLDPGEPFFADLVARFVAEQTRLMGTDHLYIADPFEEIVPPDASPAFLGSIAQAICQSLASADPEAVWIMHSWPFYYEREFWTKERIAAFLDPLPTERILVIDTFCDYAPQWKRTEAFFGKPWLWSITQSFGGRGSLYGRLPLQLEVPRLTHDPSAGTLCGIAFVTEAIEQNSVVYDLMTELAWHATSLDLEQWIKGYAHRRYGKEVPGAEDAWVILAETAYSSRAARAPRSIICERPARRITIRWESDDDADTVGSPRPAGRGYDPARLCQTWPLLLAAGEHLRDNAGFRYDLIEVAVQVLSDYAEELYGGILTAFEAGSADELRRLRLLLLGLIDDVEVLLRTRPDRLLGRWCADARAWGTSEDEVKAYDFEARRLVTVWGTRESRTLADYSGRHWSGLVASFYRPRWELFLDHLETALAAGSPFDDAAFEETVIDFEEDWLHGAGNFPSEPEGDPFALASDLYKKYEQLLFIPASGSDAGNRATRRPPEI